MLDVLCLASGRTLCCLTECDVQGAGACRRAHAVVASWLVWHAAVLVLASQVTAFAVLAQLSKCRNARAP